MLVETVFSLVLSSEALELLCSSATSGFLLLLVLPNCPRLSERILTSWTKNSEVKLQKDDGNYLPCF
jgi:hypothetical protein